MDRFSFKRPSLPNDSLSLADADTPISDIDDARPTEDHLVYYRVYTYDGAIPSNSAAYSNDCSLGRISIGQISLPRTVKSLKRCIAVVEGISVDRITLYTSATIEKTIDDKTEITFDSGPGLVPDEPMTLVFEGSEARCYRSTPDSESRMALLPPSELNSPLKPRFLYYKVYTEDGAILTEQPINSQNPSLGRINVDALTHTTASIKRYIALAEQFGCHISGQLYASASSKSPMSETCVSLTTNNFPGSNLKDPMVYVHFPSVKIKVTHALDWSNYSGWLKIEKGEIFDTDGVIRQEPHGDGKESGYTAINSEGVQGFVYSPYAQVDTANPLCFGLSPR